MVATVCLGLFVMLTVVKITAGVVLARRRVPRRRPPHASILVLGMGVAATEPRREVETSAVDFGQRSLAA